ncbi:rRNA biogenesis protein RRP5 [Frankliniella fusca]|uniref:rRNA biogenesis protein RRP5 n=1 Tax=Frankliniella fusca TaxID=407009 RepID=A0AAE1L8F0_9NEOP|nr:rRNA biogenesis protein RRP5 [Frankliniella fusca]KAK3920896.1 rRNA biogenesis protein RRP5 [Frankliniella fusca]
MTKNNERAKWTDVENNMWKHSMEREENTKDECGSSSTSEKIDDSVHEKQCPQLQNLLVFGDSFALRLCKAVDPSVKGKFNLCQGGMRINDLKHALSNISDLTLNGKGLLLLVGMNDVLKVKQEDLDGEIFSLISKVLKLNVKMLFLCTLPILPGKLNEPIENFNEEIRDFESVDENICVVDLEAIFVKEDESTDESFYEKCHYNDDYDIHPNTKGFQKMAEIILSKL